MRRYILLRLPAYDMGMIWCTVDSLDDIIGDDDFDVIDTVTGDIYFYEQDQWTNHGSVDDIKPLWLQRKSDKPVIIETCGPEEIGGYLIPEGMLWILDHLLAPYPKM